MTRTNAPCYCLGDDEILTGAPICGHLQARTAELAQLRDKARELCTFILASDAYDDLGIPDDIWEPLTKMVWKDFK